MKRIGCFLLILMLVCGGALAEESSSIEEYPYTGPCPHDVFDFEEVILDEHKALLERMGVDPKGYSTGVCEICEAYFLLHPYEADYSNVFVGTNECPHHFRKIPAVIEEGWYTVGPVGHLYKTYHIAVCALCPAYIKYYTRPTGWTATADLVKAHNWTNHSYHDDSIDVHFYVSVCMDCGMAGVTELHCWKYDNGMCSVELEEALEFYGK